MSNCRLKREQRWIGASIRHIGSKIFRMKHRQNIDIHTESICFRNGGNLEELEQIYQTRQVLPSLMDLDFSNHQQIKLPADTFKPIMCKHARLPKKPEKTLFGPIRKANQKDVSTQVNFIDLIDFEYKLMSGDILKKPSGKINPSKPKIPLLPIPELTSQNMITHKEIACNTEPLFESLDVPEIISYGSIRNSSIMISKLNVINSKTAPPKSQEIISYGAIGNSSITISKRQGYKSNADLKQKVVETSILIESSDDSNISGILIDSEAKTFKDKIDWKREMDLVFGTDSESSENELVIDENSRNTDVEISMDSNGCEDKTNDELEIFVQMDDF
ncbi:unnamed protein product [Brachionus calyciflorus]|uniref:Uncharacterized protein n=1 Tax=Brachionus calyciflorus TaxID=104777 RepID=A0A813WR98_9BILA|nr:unnamed protein product [Brachionus calyciflorus]